LHRYMHTDYAISIDQFTTLSPHDTKF